MPYKGVNVVNLRSTLPSFCFLIVLFGVAATISRAQLTVINVPSTDTLEAKRFFIEADVLARPDPLDKGGFQSYGYRTVYGIDAKTEAGVSFFYTRNAAGRPLEAQLSLKRRLYINEKFGIASAAGVTAFVPLNHAAGDRTVVSVYANISKTIKQANGLRLTAGGYRILNGGRNFGTRTGVTLAFEQPVFKRVSVVGDWSSGKNRFGYAAAGLTFILKKNQSFTASYNFGNAGQGDNFVYLFYSVLF